MAQQAKARPQKRVCGTNSRACLIPFQVTALWKVIHVLLKCALGYGPVYAKRRILCFKQDENYWTASVCHKQLSNFILLDLK